MICWWELLFDFRQAKTKLSRSFSAWFTWVSLMTLNYTCKMWSKDGKRINVIVLTPQQWEYLLLHWNERSSAWRFNPSGSLFSTKWFLFVRCCYTESDWHKIALWAFSSTTYKFFERNNAMHFSRQFQSKCMPHHRKRRDFSWYSLLTKVLRYSQIRHISELPVIISC